MKKLTSMLCAALVLASVTAWAEEPKTDMLGQEQEKSDPGMPGKKGTTSSGGMTGSESMTGNPQADQSQGTTQAKPMPGMEMQAKTTLAPHSLMIETSLMSAMSQLKGLRTQLQVAETATPEAIQHFKMHSKEISADLMMAKTHEKQLMSRMGKFPQIAQNEKTKTVSTNLMTVTEMDRTWKPQTQQKAYWQNKVKVMADLDLLEQRLNTALDSMKSFNSDQLKIASVG